LEIPVEEKFFKTAELYEAETAFFCGTAAEVIGWASLDGIPFRKDWNTTVGKIIQEAYKARITEKEFKPALAF
jgi:branched-chain amino acid aminotransferase